MGCAGEVGIKAFKWLLRAAKLLTADLALVAAGVATALIVAELALRIFMPAPPQFYRTDYYQG